MQDSADIVPAGVASPPSERVQLAGLAHDAALGVAGVHGTDPGPGGLYVTAGGDTRLEGVICVAVREGGYEVSLSLVCGLVNLYEVADSVRTAVSTAAAKAEIPLADVNVHVAGVTATPVI